MTIFIGRVAEKHARKRKRHAVRSKQYPSPACPSERQGRKYPPFQFPTSSKAALEALLARCSIREPTDRVPGGGPWLLIIKTRARASSCDRFVGDVNIQPVALVAHMLRIKSPNAIRRPDSSKANQPVEHQTI